MQKRQKEPQELPFANQILGNLKEIIKDKKQFGSV